MSINKMKRVQLVCFSADARKLADELVWLSSLEVSDPIQEDLPELRDDFFSAVDTRDEWNQWESRMQSFAKALDIIAPYRTGNSFLKAAEYDRKTFTALEESFDNTTKTVEKILDTDANRKELVESLAALETQQAALEPWIQSNLKLSLTKTDTSGVVYFTLPILGEKSLQEDNGEDDLWEIEVVSTDKNLMYCIAIFHKTALEAFRERYRQKGIHEIVPEGSDPPAVEWKAIKTRIEAIRNELKNVEDRIRLFADVGRSIETMYDRIQAEQTKVNLLGQMMAGDAVRILSGWLPAEKADRFEACVATYTVAYNLRDPEEGEDVPIQLKNNQVMAPFETVVGLYSYPTYSGIDPTFMMSIFYFIIFGMMLADFGYGLLLFLGCFGFVKWKKPVGGTRQMMLMFGICGVATMIAGVLFGSYFGDLPSAISQNFLGKSPLSLSIALDPLNEPMNFLIISLVVGAIHMLAALGIKGYMLIRDGHWFDAVCDVLSWYVLFAGMTFAWLTPVSWGNYVLYGGVAMLVLTQGREKKNIFSKLFFGAASLYNLISWGSDLMSYSRILALGLAGGVVSSVINLMATMGGPSVIGIILFVFVFLAGHGLNLAMNLLGSFVHAARLQYIEFFGKFYEDGGHPFEPTTLKPKYTRLINQ